MIRHGEDDIPSSSVCLKLSGKVRSAIKYTSNVVLEKINGTQSMLSLQIDQTEYTQLEHSDLSVRFKLFNYFLKYISFSKKVKVYCVTKISVSI